MDRTGWMDLAYFLWKSFYWGMETRPDNFKLIFCNPFKALFPYLNWQGNIECSIHLYSSPWLGLVTVCLFTLGTSIDYGKCINHLLLDGYLTTHTFTNVVIFTIRCREIVLRQRSLWNHTFRIKETSLAKPKLKQSKQKGRITWSMNREEEEPERIQFTITRRG